MPQKGVALTALAHEFGGAYAGASRDADDATQAADAARTTAPAPTADPAISGVVIDNRVVRAGDLFAALTGANRHGADFVPARSEEHTSELQSRGHLVCRLLLEKKIIIHSA